MTTPPDDIDESELVDSLSASVTPLAAVDPDAAFDDLDSVAEAVGDADVLGLGEASHGTREFFEWKSRFIRYLVEEKGLRLVGLEANFPACLDVNEYVLSGEGTSEDVLSGNVVHGPYRNETVLSLLDWMRTFNEGRPWEDRVRFHGFDVQHSSVAASKLRTYVKQVDSDVLEGVESTVDQLASTLLPDTSDDEEMEAHLDARETVLSRLGDALDENETAYVDATSREAYERASRLVWTIEQGRKQFQSIYDGRAQNGTNIRIRDSAMAAQVQWLLGHTGADQIALWGHNAHLSRDGFSGGTTRQKQDIPSLGSNLASLSNVDYYALGLTLGGGTVRAAYMPEQEFRDYDIEDPPEGSIPDVFARVEAPQFFLDLQSLPQDSVLQEWLATGPRQFGIEGGYRETPVNVVESSFPRQFDGLVFVRETTAARGL